MDGIIRLEKVSYCYPNETTAVLRDISFSIEEGDYLSIVGTSGSGKSTLLSIMGMINKPTKGTYYLHGTDVQDITEASIARLKNQEIGLIFQNFNLLAHLTVYQNVCLPLTYNTTVQRKQYRNKVLQALKEVDMESFIDRFPNQLSGGQQQRVAIARAIVNQPSLILADEPTGYLDSNNSEIIFNILEQLNVGGCTVCVITHDMNYANKAEKQLVIKDGQIETKKIVKISESSMA